MADSTPPPEQAPGDWASEDTEPTLQPSMSGEQAPELRGDHEVLDELALLLHPDTSPGKDEALAAWEMVRRQLCAIPSRPEPCSQCGWVPLRPGDRITGTPAAPTEPQPQEGENDD